MTNVLLTSGLGDWLRAVFVGRVVEQEGSTEEELTSDEPDHAPENKTEGLVASWWPNNFYEVKVALIIGI